MTSKKHFDPMTRTTLTNMSPDDAYKRLKHGNKRFLDQLNEKFEKRRKLRYFVEKTAKQGQYPFAIVLSCVDSRMPTETLFDQSIGDIFNARIAGNFVNEDILGSMEFACTRTESIKTKAGTKKIPIGAKLILVLGHTSCGAVAGATQAVYPDCFSGKDDSTASKNKFTPTHKNLAQLLEKIAPAAQTTCFNLKKREKCTNKGWQSRFINRVAEQNVALTINNILTQSEDLRSLHNSGDIRVEGAMYHVDTGEVEFLKRRCVKPKE